jgi:hypothetical protein
MKTSFAQFISKWTWAYHRYKPRFKMTEFLNFVDMHKVAKYLESSADTPLLTFFCVSDFGNHTEGTRATAGAMDEYARHHGSPDFVLGLGIQHRVPFCGPCSRTLTLFSKHR